ncbi:ABC transporter substrate-binding protein [Glaciihabitans sp. dw_435]|uniref:ABC transporter substrate-binding protein n=1 Tax=Glaciihabitans sp. dw_435 TaxID=2720081 RepID=UPI001BD4BB69|nr:ABC transporter substrate-binding protein [Glaciihabitans sp. dw_435]
MTHSRIRHWRRRTVAIAIVAASATLALSACASPGPDASSASDSTTPVKGGALVFDIANDPINLNPRATGSGNDTLYVLRQLVDSLTSQDPTTGKVIPWLAQSWTANADATAFTFVLRSGVTFSDGTPLTADVVKANFDDIVANGAQAAGAITALPGYVGTTVKDDTTFTVTFSSPNGAFPQALSSPSLGITALSTLKVPFDDRATGEAIIGSGPFTLKSYTKNTSVELSKRAGYAWAPSTYSNTGEAYLDSVTFSVVPEAGVRTGSLTSGQVDVIGGVLPQDIETLRSSKLPLIIRANPGLSFGLSPFASHAKLSDVNVRLALLTAIDRTTVRDATLTPDFKVATSVLAANTPGYIDLSKQIAYDPKKSEQLLDDAGWKVGSDGIREKDGEKLSLTIGYISNFAANQSVLEIIQQELKTIGVDVSLVSGTVPQYLADSAAGKFDLVYGNLSRADGDVLRTQFSAAIPTNTRGNTDDELNSLLVDQLAVADQSQRNTLAQQASARIIDLGYNIPVVELTTVIGTTASVHGVVLGADSRLGSLVDAYKSGK